ncbi:hypothetical protein IPA_09565 [Ignicoccus pacificus DSM 13166]|uniref:4Fe-4S ferredoxin-type domain-containing protein n=1 Tax=Ignicoccus pacificus DSM 13166 TaxID=940294 RepID=A0A977KC01_9CREN|nr:hypothetical protein IPA_09565 [Ignicoccus pacificus DSM 13166]
MSKRKRWFMRTDIVWDIEKNVPTFKSTCWDCNVVELPMTDPGDARLAFESDLDILREALNNEFGAPEYWKDVVGSGVVLVNKGAGLDDFRELFARGTIIGKLYWDLFEGKWRFRLSYASAKVLLEKGIMNTFEVDEHPKEGANLFSEGCEEGTQIVLVKNGEPVGIGYCRKNGRIRVVTSFPPEIVGKEPFPAKDKPTTWDDVVKHNEYRIRMMTSQAKRFLYNMINKVKKTVTVSFSGGKDSLVALHLTKQLVEPIVVFNNTGIEMPETVETVERVVKAWDLKLVTADAGDDFWHALRMIGPPARDLRWCCKVAKLVPMAKLVKERWPEGTLNVVGQRAFESIERAKSPRVWRNKWFPQVLNISPIQDWTQLDVWLYIYSNDLMEFVNPLYFKGFERVGCFMCPASLMAEFEFTKKVHPELWGRWERELERWRKLLGLPEEWSKYGLWRWLSYSTKKKTILRKLGIEYDWKREFEGRIHPSIVEKTIENERVELEFSSRIDLALKDQYSVLGKPSEDGIVSDEIKVSFGQRKVAIIGSNPIEGAIEVSALIQRWFKCLRCKSCEVWCPTGSIKVTTRPKIDSESCISCKLCLLECPMYDPFADRVVSAVILDDPNAWKRKTKMSRKELVKKLKESVVEEAQGLGGVGSEEL